MNFLKRFVEFISSPSNSRTTSLLVILIIALSIPLTVFVAQKQQEIRQQAAVGACNPSDPCTGWTYVTCDDPATGVVGGHKASCGGNTDETCYAGQAPNLTTLCAKPATPAPTPTQAPATQAPATSAPSVGGSAPVCQPRSGAVSTCDPTVDRNRNNPQPCAKVCPDGITIVQGISVMECQSDFCWYDSLYDTNKPDQPPKTQPERNKKFCYYGPTNDPKEAGCPTLPPAISREECASIDGTCLANVSSCPDNRSMLAACLLPGFPNGICCKNAPSPTPTPTSTPTPALGDTIFTLTVGLNGLGITGDSKNPSSFNPNPRKSTRSFKVEVFDLSNNKITEKSGSLNLSGGKFTGPINMGTISNGTYVVKVKSNGFVRKRVPGTITITAAGQTIALSSVNLPNGDIVSSETVDVLDYNLILGCIFKAFSSSCEITDLDDNGTVDQFDYNLFLREFSQSGD